ncbi:filamentous hemagglutinin N-terminal domain-containing protein [Erwinia sp. AnSW2-5]|uniref:filamentous hemagglutinin N-terminal domain-containing protein n=1 Tax=Erwinia sp. AnSW2-5 TaxID=3367692 RepID=UPI00385B22C5
MDKLNHPLARGVSYLLIYLTALQPVFAAGISVSHPAMQAEAGTVPIINIATPNAAGISHNQYAEFNVGKTGAVLNNATEAGNSQLAGALTANPHLNDQGAALIINEVTSSSASELQGKLEVFGHSAGVMIANPNGIRCDGCGAINSPALTLTTGKPQFLAQGELQALEVRQGTVSVGPGGLDGSGQDYVDIISRATELNGKITAHNLALTQGVNRVDYPAGGVTALAASGSAPQLAIDTKALGGMYADKIRLLATENGVGVNLSNLTTHQQSITLTSSGQLQLSNISAKTDLNVSGRGITLSPGSSLTSGADITLAADQVTNSGTVVAAKDLRLFSDRVSNTGKGAQLRAGGGMWIQKNAAGERASLVENRSANISSGGDLVIRAVQLNNLRNAVVTGQQKAAADDKGMFIYGSAFNAAKYGNPNKRPDYDGGLRQYRELSVSATLVDAFLSAFYITWINDDSTHYFVQADAQPGGIQAGGNLYASSGTLLNAASELRAGGNMVLTGGSFDALSYHGGLQQDFVKFAHDFETDKTDGFKHINYLKTDEHRSALITDTAINSHITAAGELVADFKDHISASLPLPLTPTELTSAPRADTFSAKNILLHAGIISSNDGISATENLTLLADDSISQQRGRLSAGNSLSLTAVNNISNLQGNLKGRSVDMISRQGSILSGTPATSRSFSADYQQQFSILNAGTLSLTAGQHIALNDTQLLISDALSATSGGDLSILNSDKLLKGPDLLIRSDLLAQQQHLDQALVTPGRTHVTGDITLVAAGDLSLDGVSLNAGKNIALLAGKNVSLNPRSLSPDSHRTQKILDRYTEYDTDFFPTSRTPELRAVLAAGNDLQIHAGADLRTDGAKLTSGANATLIAGRNMSLGALAYSFIDNLNDNNKDDRQLVSEVQAAKNLTLTTNGDLTSAGSRLSAGGDLAAAAAAICALNR